MSWCKNVGPSTCVIHAGDVSVNRLSLNHRCCRTFCGVADTINTKQMGQTDEALDELHALHHDVHGLLRKLREVLSADMQRGGKGAMLSPRFCPVSAICSRPSIRQKHFRTF